MEPTLTGVGRTRLGWLVATECIVKAIISVSTEKNQRKRGPSVVVILNQLDLDEEIERLTQAMTSTDSNSETLQPVLADSERASRRMRT